MTPLAPLTLILSMAAVGQAPAPTWALVEPESWLAVRLTPKSSGLLAGFAHDHVVRATHFTGELHFDPKEPASCSLKLEIAVKDLAVDQPEARQHFKMKDGPDEGDRRKITEHMLADDQLDIGKHPKIRFASTGCTAKGEGVLVRGELEIHGQKKAFEVPMKITTEGDKITARGSFGLGHDFGFEPYSAALGSIGNARALNFDVELVAKKK